MNDKKFIIAGLIIFFAVALMPFWFNFGKAAPAPEPELSAEGKGRKILCFAQSGNEGRAHADS